MLTCHQVRLLLSYGGQPGTPRKGIPALGFHLAECAACRELWESQNIPLTSTDIVNSSSDEAAPNNIRRLVSRPAQAFSTTRTGELAFLEQLLSANTFSEEDQSSIAVSEQPVPSQRLGVTPQPVTYTALLRNPNFRRLWLGQAISTFGSFFTRIAVPIYVFSVTHSYSQLGLAYFSSFIAPLLFGLFAGAFVDRLDQRRMMIATAIANGGVLIALIICTALPLPITIKLSSIYLANFAAALLQEMFKPARIAIFADILAAEELLAANSLDGATTTFSEFLSYPLAAAAIYYVGPTIAFGIDAASFFISALLIWGVSVKSMVADKKINVSIWGDIAEGLTVARNMPMVRKVIILSLFVPLFISLFNTLQLPYSVDALRSTATVGFPALEASMALGVVIGMLLIGKWAQSIPRSLLLTYGIGVYGMAITAQGLVPFLINIGGWTVSTSLSPWTPALFLALPFALLSGAANSMINASIRTMLQEQTPRAILGRVYSVVNVVAGIGFGCGALLTGIAQGRAAIMLTLLGMILLMLGVACHRWLPEREQPVLVFDPKY